MLETRTLRRLAIAAAMTLIAAVAPASTAQAHSSSTYYYVEWPDYAQVSYGINAGFPGGEMRSRLIEAKNAWNNADFDRAPNFYWSLPDDVNHGTAQNPCGIAGFNTGAIFWNDLDYLGSSVLGSTRFCYSSVIWNFTTEFDNDAFWYTGSGDAPSTQWDFLSIATHEFGHAFGMNGSNGGHYPEGDSICPEDGSRHTMCPYYSGDRGTEHLRTLGDHDRHTFDVAY